MGRGCGRRYFLKLEGEGLSRMITFRMKPEWQKGAHHTKASGKNTPGKLNSYYKGSKAGTDLAYSKLLEGSWS